MRHILFTLCILLAGCAKHRDLETLKDPNSERLDKSVFTGSAKSPSTWFSKVTVTKTSSNSGFLFVGLQSDMKMGHFEFTQEKLKFFNDVTPYREGSEQSVSELINSWDITHHDTMLQESDGQVTNKEVEDDKKSWDQKRQFKINFAEADISEGATFPYYIDSALSGCWEAKTAYLVDGSLETSEDYIGFSVGVDYQMGSLCSEDIRRSVRGDYTYTAHFYYSFKKVKDTGYEPYVYKGENDPLMKRFGYFQTIRERINPDTGRFENFILMNRWNPNQTHHYYFVKGFPEKYKWIFNDPKKGIFAKTNEVLAKAGVKARFEIHENTGQKFGDLRHSFINVIESMDSSAPFGYGPSDANPLTGEIISGNVMIWTGFLKYYLQRIQDTTERKPVKFEESSLFTAMKGLLEQDNPADWVTELDQTSGVGKIYNDLLPELTFGYPGWAKFTSSGAPEIFNFKSETEMNRFVRDDSARNMVREARQVAKKAVRKTGNKVSHQRNTTLYPMEHTLVNAQNLLIEGKAPKDIIDTILYRVSIHELGHNLGLRHNFYASVDKKNFGPVARVQTPEGVKEFQQKSSSVMEYLALEDEIHGHHEWEAYDVAALSFAYTGGKVSSKKNFLYCTDEHRVLNALCNHFDTGTSPSEVMLSMIKRYEDMYYVRNYRRDRAYWATSSYGSSIFSTMWDIKKFLLLWRSAYNDNTIRRLLQERGEHSSVEIEAYRRQLSAEMKQAVKLSVAFYNAVIRQSASDRPYLNEVEPFTGETKRIGILYDKLYAMMFLMGDDAFMYNPNASLSAASFLTYSNQPELSEVMEKVFENSLTERVDMEPWFIGYARGLYAQASTNIYNRSDIRLVNKVKISRFSPLELKEYFGVQPKPELSAEVVRLTKSDHSYYRMNEEVGVVSINDRYYVVSKFRAPYAFDLVQSIVDSQEGGNSTVSGKAELLELFTLYQEAKGDSL